jgi:hypothetical protein
MSFMSFPTSTSVGRPESRMLGEEEVHRRGRGTVPACRLERERAAGEKIDPLPCRWRRAGVLRSSAPLCC